MGFSSSGSGGGMPAALEENSAASSSSSPFSFSFSFSDLLNSDATTTFSVGGRRGVPKFKSVPPPSLPLSPHASYFAIPAGMSPTELLESPVFLSSSQILPSPTTGALKAKATNLNTTTTHTHMAAIKPEQDKGWSDFSFQAQPSISHHFPTEQALKVGGRSLPQDQQQGQQQQWVILQDQKKNEQSNKDHQKIQSTQTDLTTKQKSGSTRSEDDEYNWRKYGQKQVKGSENPRSYYKCTYPGCPTKKKVEKSLEGQITEIVYKGTHNHSKPVKNRRSSSSSSTNNIPVSASASAAGVIQASPPLYNYAINATMNMDVPHQDSSCSFGSGKMDPSTAADGATPDNSSISIVDDEIDHRRSPRSRSPMDSFVDEDDGHQPPEAKRWKGDIIESECLSAAAPGNRAVREPRVVVQTTSDIDILDDGYRWRKYGQKVVKGNPNPRSYYKCTFPGCPVRKHVERAAHDIRAVITTYEGKHNHDIPVARGSSHSRAQLPPPGQNYFALNYGHNTTCEQGQSTPFLQEMLQGRPGGSGLSGYGRSNLSSIDSSSYNSLIRLQNSQHTATKEEPGDEDVFFDSLLC